MAKERTRKPAEGGEGKEAVKPLKEKKKSVRGAGGRKEPPKAAAEKDKKPDKARKPKKKPESKVGRPSEYRAKYADMLIGYFGAPPQKRAFEVTYHQNGNIKSKKPVLLPAELPTFEGFAELIGVSRATLYNWAEVRSGHPEFAEAVERAKEIQERIIVQNAMTNMYNANFARFYMSNRLGYSDKRDVDLKNSISDADRELLLKAEEIAELLKNE